MLENLCRTNGLVLLLDKDLWMIRPADDQALVGKAYEIEKGHYFWVGEFSGTFFNEQGEGSPMHKGGLKCPGFNDLDFPNKHTNSGGYCVLTDLDGRVALGSIRGRPGGEVDDAADRLRSVKDAPRSFDDLDARHPLDLNRKVNVGLGIWIDGERDAVLEDEQSPAPPRIEPAHPDVEPAPARGVLSNCEPGDSPQELGRVRRIGALDLVLADDGGRPGDALDRVGAIAHDRNLDGLFGAPRSGRDRDPEGERPDGEVSRVAAQGALQTPMPLQPGEGSGQSLLESHGTVQ